MSKLVRLTEAPEGTEVFVNPDHVQSIRSISNETVITFSDGSKMTVKEAPRVAVSAIQMDRDFRN